MICENDSGTFSLKDGCLRLTDPDGDDGPYLFELQSAAHTQELLEFLVHYQAMIRDGVEMENEAREAAAQQRITQLEAELASLRKSVRQKELREMDAAGIAHN